MENNVSTLKYLSFLVYTPIYIAYLLTIMENNVVQPTGFAYLWSYSGGLNLLEELLNVTVIISLALSGYSTKADLLIGFAVLASVYTAVLIVLHIRGVIRRSRLAWHWIECVSVLMIGILLVILSTVVIAVYTRGYIISGIMGYVSAMVYFVDTFDKYQIAITPVPKYAWTTPNMPDLN